MAKKDKNNKINDKTPTVNTQVATKQKKTQDIKPKDDLEKFKKQIKKQETKISVLEKDNKELIKNNKSFLKNIDDLNSKINDLNKWKTTFDLIDKDFNNPKELNSRLPFLLLDIMKNVNNLNNFNQKMMNVSLENVSQGKKRKLVNYEEKFSSDDEEYIEDEEDDEEDDEDDDDYYPYNSSIHNNRKIILVYPEFKTDTNLKRILVYFKLEHQKFKLSNRDKQLLCDYIQLFQNNNKLKSITQKDLLYFIQSKYDDKLNMFKTEEALMKLNQTDVSPRYKILNSHLPIEIKDKCISKLNTLNNLEPSSSEYNKLNNWINGLLSIPWSIYKPLSINYENSDSDEIYNFLNDSIKKLDASIYGQNKTKQHIINVVSKIITNPKSIGNVFSIYGPMGTGKTTLIKEGLSKLLGLPFIFISLGGSTDSSFLDGHSYTYEGSTPGRIVEALKSAQCMNPIFYFDELDKVSETSRGMEIINLLIHLTDPSQNSHFFDKYYGEVPFDLSKALFVFSFNHLERVNPILRDRMHLIKVDGFSFEEKFVICRDYLLPAIYKEYQITNDDLIFDEDVIKYIINKKTSSFSVEEGVRNVKRRFELIISNMNVIRISFNNLKSSTNDNKKIKLEINWETITNILPELKLKISSSSNHNLKNVLNNIGFPCNINKDIVDLFIGDIKNTVAMTMYT